MSQEEEYNIHWEGEKLYIEKTIVPFSSHIILLKKIISVSGFDDLIKINNDEMILKYDYNLKQIAFLNDKLTNADNDFIIINRCLNEYLKQEKEKNNK